MIHERIDSGFPESSEHGVPERMQNKILQQFQCSAHLLVRLVAGAMISFSCATIDTQECLELSWYNGLANRLFPAQEILRNPTS